MKRKIFILSGAIGLIDQLIKLLVVTFLTGSIQIIPHFFYLTYVGNTGAAWGMLSGSRWILIIVSILAIYAVIKYFLLDVEITKMEFIAYGLLLGGIVGNLIDRIFRGFVVDFADFRIFNHQFPIFNVADSAIVIGAFLIIYHLISKAIEQRRLK